MPRLYQPYTGTLHPAHSRMHELQNGIVAGTVPAHRFATAPTVVRDSAAALLQFQLRLCLRSCVSLDRHSGKPEGPKVATC